ncbi:hypothetical protein [Leptospira sp. GIMC2001]|uniref:hypothetical protein n=1 Tax=Leptospira sp. GIMC2001 TaxID=1513297 RepID=UPI00234B7BD0|nr:hypothetical protein [Leptospira sp. GIMC2001]WCL50934.1 hypothetical protein O4O04_09025 [Leptospira sp. GIMC2001]
MEFLLFLLFILINLLLVGCVSYYARILFFQKKREYDREEIVALGRSIPSEILRIFESGGNLGIGAGIFLFGCILVGLWARLGGLIGSPHYAHAMGNYIFHFPLFFIIFTFGYTFLHSALGGNSHKEPSKTFWANCLPFAAGLGIGSISKSLSSYGAFHEMYFIFVIAQYLIVGIISAFLWNSRKFFGISLTKEILRDDYDRDFDDYSDDYDRSYENVSDDYDGYSSHGDDDKTPNDQSNSQNSISKFEKSAKMENLPNRNVSDLNSSVNKTKPNADLLDDDFGVNLDAFPEPSATPTPDSDFNPDLDWGNDAPSWDDLDSEEFK